MADVKQRVLRALERNREQIRTHRQAKELGDIEGFICMTYEKAFIDCAVICGVIDRDEAARLRTPPPHHTTNHEQEKPRHEETYREDGQAPS